MNSVSATDEVKRRALRHVVSSINRAACFPRQVFRGDLSAVLFFESDRLFSAGFALIAAGLLELEQAEVCCLLNFSATDALVHESAATLFIDAKTDPLVYDAMLRQGGPAKGWLFGMDRYGSTSDRGGWSIYCEKGNDIAAIALRGPGDEGKYRECLKATACGAYCDSAKGLLGGICAVWSADGGLAPRLSSALRQWDGEVFGNLCIGTDGRGIVHSLTTTAARRHSDG